MEERIRSKIEEISGAEITSMTSLAGGSIGDVRSVLMTDGTRLVAKLGPSNSNIDPATDSASYAGLALEGWMLNELRSQSNLPVPDVYFVSEALLMMEQLPTGGKLGGPAQEQAADLLAQLHNITAPNYGLDRDTLIGGLPQPNPQTGNWYEFFAEHRLIYMAESATRSGRLDRRLAARIETLAGRAEQWIEKTGQPSLIHGDMWDGNVLCGPHGISGFIDPAIYYADAEIELAFATLFNSFGETFFGRYGEHRPIRPGFFEVRRDLYNLYPLLVHVQLFGGSYQNHIREILDRL